MSVVKKHTKVEKKEKCSHPQHCNTNKCKPHSCGKDVDTIFGKCGQTHPHVCHPKQGLRWVSHDYQNEFIYNDCKWHRLDPQAGCDTVLLDYKFTEHTAQDVLNDFNANIFGTDGTLSIDNEGLLIVANPFTATIPLGNEHSKHLRYYKNAFPLSDCYETYYETEIAVEQYVTLDQVPIPFRNRIRNIFEDIRLCSGAINTLDPVSWTVTDIFLSNEKIYCFVERLPFGQTPQHKYAAFSAAVYTHQRTGDPFNDFIKIGIGLKKNSANYYINGELVFSVSRFGERQADSYRLLDHQGTAEIATMDSVYLGFGLFSLLDMQLPYNYARQLVLNDFNENQSASGLVQLDNTAAYGEILPGQSGDNRPIVDPAVTWAVTLNQYPDDNHDVKLFGQGAALRMRYFKVCKRY